MVEFICADDEGCMGKGATLKAAYADYCDMHNEDAKPDDLIFYEVEPIQVEVQFVKKEVVKSIKAAK